MAHSIGGPNCCCPRCTPTPAELHRAAGKGNKPPGGNSLPWIWGCIGLHEWAEVGCSELQLDAGGCGGLHWAAVGCSELQGAARRWVASRDATQPGESTLEASWPQEDAALFQSFPFRGAARLGAALRGCSAMRAPRAPRAAPPVRDAPTGPAVPVPSRTEGLARQPRTTASSRTAGEAFAATRRRRRSALISKLCQTNLHSISRVIVAGLRVPSRAWGGARSSATTMMTSTAWQAYRPSLREAAAERPGLLCPVHRQRSSAPSRPASPPFGLLVLKPLKVPIPDSPLNKAPQRDKGTGS